jgi:CRISPR/Cas system-associated exonuclease Cas4 (RecB family)
MEAGKSIEVSLVKTYEQAGILLSASPDSDIQTGFELPEVWLTGSVDAIIKPYNWNMPIPIEIKTKYAHVIEEMLKGRGPDKAHISQIKVQLAFVRMYQEKMWPGLDPVTHGYLYYLSRDNPHNTAEFRVDLDQRFFDMGVERLRQWRHYFEEDVLPSIDPSKKHPMGWRWSYRPCSWCDYKPVCKSDHEKGTQALSESVGIPRANLVREHYDFDEARKRVKERWKDT